MTCPNCAHLQAELRRLQAENHALRVRLARVAGYAAVVMSRADQAMSNGGLPRGTWSMWRGARQTAEKVRQLAE